jgi:hypothetical protein
MTRSLWMGNIAQGLKPALVFGAFAARVNSRPDTKPASPLQGSTSISLLNPTLKRGANNRCASGAFGSPEVVPFHDDIILMH